MDNAVRKDEAWPAFNRRRFFVGESWLAVEILF